MLAEHSSWTLLVLVCGNERSAASGRPSCGRERASRLRRHLRDRARSAGLRDAVVISRTTCLGVCSPRGTTVVLTGRQGPPCVSVLPHEASVDAIWGVVIERLRST